MVKFGLLVMVLALIAGPAFGAGDHAGGHHTTHAIMAAGMPGKAVNISQTIEILMKETDDGDMIFVPNSITTKKNQTVRLVIKNVGELEHEFVLDDHEGIAKHKLEMERAEGEMKHNDPNALRLEPNKDGSIVWKFTKDGNFEFACLIPGHYEAGMKGDVSVTAPNG